jgi:plasmid stability protein
VGTKEAIAMPIIHVRGIPQTLHDDIKLRAALEHRSFSAEVIALLERGLKAQEPRFSIDEWLENARRFREELARELGGKMGADSATLIREDRDSR